MTGASLDDVGEGSESLEDFENTRKKNMIEFDDCLSNESNLQNMEMNNSRSNIFNANNFLGDESNPPNTQLNNFLSNVFIAHDK